MLFNRITSTSSRGVTNGLSQRIGIIFSIVILEVLFMLQANANPLSSTAPNDSDNQPMLISSSSSGALGTSTTAAVEVVMPSPQSDIVFPAFSAQVISSPLPTTLAIESSELLAQHVIASISQNEEGNVILLEPSSSHQFEPRSSSSDGIGHLLMAQLAQSLLSDFNIREEYSDLSASPTLLKPLLVTSSTGVSARHPPSTPTKWAPTIRATPTVTDGHFPTSILSSFLSSALPEVIDHQQLIPTSVDHWSGDSGIDSLLDNLINPPRPPLPSLVTTFRPTAIRYRPSSSVSSIRLSLSSADAQLLIKSSSVLSPLSNSLGGASISIPHASVGNSDYGHQDIASSFFEKFLSTVRTTPLHKLEPSSTKMWQPIASVFSFPIGSSLRPLVRPSEHPLVVANIGPSIQHPLEDHLTTSLVSYPSVTTASSHLVGNYIALKTGSPMVELLLPSSAIFWRPSVTPVAPISASSVAISSALASTASTHATSAASITTITNADSEEKHDSLQIQDLSLVRPNQPDATVDKIIAGLMDIIRPLKGSSSTGSTVDTLPLQSPQPTSDPPVSISSPVMQEANSESQHPFAASGDSLSSVLQSLNSHYMLTEQDHRVTTPLLMSAAITTPVVIAHPMKEEHPMSTFVAPLTSLLSHNFHETRLGLEPSASLQMAISSAIEQVYQLQEKNEPVLESNAIPTRSPFISTVRPSFIPQAVLKRKPVTKRPTTPVPSVPTRLRTTTSGTILKRPTTTEQLIPPSIHSWGEAKPILLDLTENNSQFSDSHLIDSRLPIELPPIGGGIIRTPDTVVGSNVLHIKGGGSIGSSSGAALQPVLMKRPALIFASSDRPITTSSHVRLPVGSSIVLSPSVASSRPSIPSRITPHLDTIPELLELPSSSSVATIISSQATVFIKPTPVAASSQHPIRQTILNTVVTISDSSSSSDGDEEFAHFDNGHSSSNQLMSSSFDLPEPFEPAVVVDPPNTVADVPAAPVPLLPPRRTTTRRPIIPTTEEPTTTTSGTTSTTSGTTSTTTSSTTSTTTKRITTLRTTTKRTRRPFFSRRTTSTRRPLTQRSTTTRRPLLRLSTTTRPPRSTTPKRNAMWPFRTATTRKPPSSVFLKRPAASDTAIATTTNKPVPARPAQTMMSYGMSLLPAAVIATIIGIPLVLAGKKKRDVSAIDNQNSGEHWRRLMREIEQLGQPQFN